MQAARSAASHSSYCIRARLMRALSTLGRLAKPTHGCWSFQLIKRLASLLQSRQNHLASGSHHFILCEPCVIPLPKLILAAVAGVPLQCCNHSWMSARAVARPAIAEMALRAAACWAV